jgi:hypothetical protein
MRRTFGKPNQNAIYIDTNSHGQGIDVEFDFGSFYDLDEFDYEADDEKGRRENHRLAKRQAIMAAMKDLSQMQDNLNMAKTWLREQHLKLAK